MVSQLFEEKVCPDATGKRYTHRANPPLILTDVWIEFSYYWILRPKRLTNCHLRQTTTSCWSCTPCTSKPLLVTTTSQSQVCSTWKTATSGTPGSCWRVLPRKMPSNNTSNWSICWSRSTVLRYGEGQTSVARPRAGPLPPLAHLILLLIVVNAMQCHDYINKECF